MVVVSVFALYLSMESLMISLKFGSVSHGLRLPMSLFLAAVPIGFTLLLYRLAQSISRDVSNFINGKQAYEGGRLFD
jgi:TRAP-type C4-dicarboxylate transport system permease small subunit